LNFGGNFENFSSVMSLVGASVGIEVPKGARDNVDPVGRTPDGLGGKLVLDRAEDDEADA
jgi:hypothetical protein